MISPCSTHLYKGNVYISFLPVLMIPSPNPHAAYATIRREITRRGIMGGDSSSGRAPSDIGSGLAVHIRSEKSSFRRDDRSNLKCSHCGGTCHTEDGCFKLIEYPEWWEELRQRKSRHLGHNFSYRRRG